MQQFTQSFDTADQQFNDHIDIFSDNISDSTDQQLTHCPNSKFPRKNTEFKNEFRTISGNLRNLHNLNLLNPHNIKNSRFFLQN